MPGDTWTWVGPSGDELSLTDGATYHVLWDSALNHLDGPTVRFAEESSPVGSRFTSASHGPTVFNLPVIVKGSTDVALRSAVRDLRVAVDGARGAGTLRLTPPDGVPRQISGRFLKPEVPVQFGRASSEEHQMVLLTFQTDGAPYWEDASQTSQVIEASATGGLFFPIPDPDTGTYIDLVRSVVFDELTISNTGDVRAEPVWSIQGPAASVTLSNLTTGKAMIYTSSIPGGEQIRVDTRHGARTVTNISTGANVFGNLSDASTLWALEKGSNLVRIEVVGESSATSVGLAYRQRYLLP